MSVFAELHDGRRLEFPDGTDPAVVQATVKKVLAGGESKPAKSPEEEYLGRVGSIVEGATGITRNVFNMLKPGSGNILPPDLPKSDEPGWKTAGQILDPAALAIGAGVGKVLPYVPMLGKGAIEGLKAAGRNAASGAAAGGTIGGLSEDGSALSGATAGAGLMMGLPVALGAGRYLGSKIGENLIGPLTEGGRTAAARAWLNKLFEQSGQSKAPVIDALMNQKPIVSGSPVTAADALASANMGQSTKFGAPLVAAQNILERQPAIADMAKTMAARGEAARAGEIGQIAQTPQALNLAVQERTAVTAPMRERALEGANRFSDKIAAIRDRATQTEAAAQQAQELQGTALGMEAQQAGIRGPQSRPVGSVSVPRNPNRYPAGEMGSLPDNARKSAVAANDAWVSKSVNQAEADLANWQLQQYESRGLAPIDGNKLASAVEARLRDPEKGVSDLNKRVISKVAEKIKEWTDQGTGRLDAKALYEIRKTTINEEVERLMPNATASAKARRAAGLLTDIKPAIDDTIEKAGGNGWKEYLAEYSNRSKDIERMQIGQKLEEALASPTGQESPRRLLTTARDMEAELEGKLLPEQNAAVERVTQELERNAERKALGSNVDMGSIMRVSESGKVEIPHILSRGATATNWLMGKMGTAADQKIATDMGRLLVSDPQAFATKYLADVPQSRAKVIIAELRARLKPLTPVALSAASNGSDNGP
jgi:hypothetical protein